MAPKAPQDGESATTQPHRSGEESAAPDTPLQLEGIDLARVFVSSAPTDERLAHILRCLLRKTGPQHPEQPEYGTGFLAEDIELVGKDRSGVRVGVYDKNIHWTFLDPGVEDLRIRNGEDLDAARVHAVERIRSMWPLTFGQLQPSKAGSPPTFVWEGSFPEHVWGAYYRLDGHGRPNRTIAVLKAPGKHRQPGEPGRIATEQYAPRQLGELPSHGRIWAVFLPAKYAREEAMPINVLVFLANYCQSVDILNKGVEDTPGDDHPYRPGFRFIKTFLGTDYSATPVQYWHLELRISSTPQSVLPSEPIPSEVVLQYHAKQLTSRHPALFPNPKKERPVRLPGLTFHRQPGAIRDYLRVDSTFSIVNDHRFREVMSSVSLSILNTQDAPYTIVLCSEKHELLAMDPNLAQGSIDKAGDAVFPDRLTAQLNGLRPSGRCTGLTQFMLMVLALSRQWEDEWMHTLGNLDKVAAFNIDDTLAEKRLDLLMFDDSFQRSRTYFATIETLRKASDMVNDALQSWSYLRRQWDAAVRPSRMFSLDDLAAAAHNWDTTTALLEASAQRIQNQITRKTESLKSLRDGLFNASALREASKGLALNRAVYVFTIVTVLYTPIGFLATLWALPIFYTSSSDEGAEPSRPALPPGFIASFVAVPLATYAICVLIVYLMSSWEDIKAFARWARYRVPPQGIPPHYH